MNPSYTYIKDGTYYYCRVVPKDLRNYHIKPKLVRCLHCKSHRHAAVASKHVTAQLEQEWLELRLANKRLSFETLLKTTAKASISDAPLLSDAVEFYLDVKARDKPKVFRQAVDRAVRYLVECHGNKAISDYSSKDASLFRDALKEKGLGNGSIKKTFGVIKALLNLSISEHGLDIKNPFVGTYLEPEVVEQRLSIKGDELIKLQKACLEINDEVRLLVALISESNKVFKFDNVWASVGSTTISRRLNTAIRKITGSEVLTSYSFRHGWKNHAILATAPTDIQNRVGGWVNTTNQSAVYGRGGDSSAERIKIYRTWQARINSAWFDSEV